MSTPMTEPAKVHRVPDDTFSVDIPKYEPFTAFLVNGEDVTDSIASVSFSTRTLKLHEFGKVLNVDHAAYYEMSQEYLDRDYQEFYNGLVDNCKDLFIQAPQFSVFYDSLRHQDVISWKVRAGSDQIDFFKDLFVGPPEIREVEKRVYIVELPHTIRECLQQAWIIFKKRFKK